MADANAPKIEITKYLGCMGSQELMNIYSSLTGGSASETIVRTNLARVREIRVNAKSPKRKDPRAKQFCDELEELIKAKFPGVYNAGSDSGLKPGQVLDFTKKAQPAASGLEQYVLQSRVPSTIVQGTSIRVEKVDAPLPGKKDYSLRLSDRRRVFVDGGVAPKPGDLVVIDRTIRPGELYAGTLKAAPAPAKKPADYPAQAAMPEMKPITSPEKPAAPTPETKKEIEPAYLARLPEAIESLKVYTTLLMESDKTLMDFDATAEGALEELVQGSRKLQEQKSQLDKPLSYIAEIMKSTGYQNDPRVQEYMRAFKSVEDFERTLNARIADLEKLAKASARDYAVKLPEAPKPAKPQEEYHEPEPARPAQDEKPANKGTIDDACKTVYIVQVIAGKESANVVFESASALPKTPNQFLDYLRDSTNFPDRTERRVIGAFCKTLDEGGTITTSSGRLDQYQDFAGVFEGGREVLLEVEMPVKAKETSAPAAAQPKKEPVKAKTAQMGATKGGGLGYIG